MTLYPQQSIHYKTFVKVAIVGALRDAFAGHPDTNLRETKITAEFPTTKLRHPAIIVRFFERTIQNVGIGHEEWIDGVRYQHYWWNGDIELEIRALDPLSADYISNTIVQIITVGQLEQWTNLFFQRIYDETDVVVPDVAANVLNLNSDQISGFGESREPAPWLAEDAFVFKNSYRVAAMGEYYSIPMTPLADQFIRKVLVYPYDSEAGDPVPTGTDDPAPWVNQ